MVNGVVVKERSGVFVSNYLLGSDKVAHFRSMVGGV